jgi:hypothetical protein
MWRTNFVLKTGGALVALVTLACSAALAGDRVRAAHYVIPPTRPVVATVVRPGVPVTIEIAVTTPVEPASDNAVIRLRGPDGQVRRFAVEGGPEALASRIVILRPGESITLRLGSK